MITIIYIMYLYFAKLLMNARNLVVRPLLWPLSLLAALQGHRPFSHCLLLLHFLTSLYSRLLSDLQIHLCGDPIQR